MAGEYTELEQLRHKVHQLECKVKELEDYIQDILKDKEGHDEQSL